ncbi:MAG TPA: SDR family oxidoreductase [Steroidobacteraceae bacterium]|nr:SDR family oxidoreductase [Steroidobacteraceae bacterium]
MTFSLDHFRLDRKVAIVTGAGGRANSIGRAYALGLADAGASVVVADIKAEGAQNVRDEIVSAGGKAIAVGVDITKPDSVQHMATAATDAFGGVDILVNNAALMAELGYLPAIDIPIDQWNRILEVNLTGALICAQAIVPLMRKRGGGKIINQVSGGAFPALSVYGVGKLALVGLTTTLARQLGREKINVNAIAPGNTMSDAGKMLTPDESPFVKMLEATVAMRVRGQPDELVGALLLLCSPAGDWITGQVLHVDGGWVLRP